MKNLKSKKFAERSAWMVIYIILLNGRDIQSMYLRIVLSYWTNVILGHRILGNQKKIFMQRIKLKISKPNSDSCRRRQRKGKESQWRNLRLILTLTLMTYQSVRFSIFFWWFYIFVRSSPTKVKGKENDDTIRSCFEKSLRSSWISKTLSPWSSKGKITCFCQRICSSCSWRSKLWRFLWKTKRSSSAKHLWYLRLWQISFISYSHEQLSKVIKKGSTDFYWYN